RRAVQFIRFDFDSLLFSVYVKSDTRGFARPIASRDDVRPFIGRQRTRRKHFHRVGWPIDDDMHANFVIGEERQIAAAGTARTVHSGKDRASADRFDPYGPAKRLLGRRKNDAGIIQVLLALEY